jgi:ketosteroid isomerase-like protein
MPRTADVALIREIYLLWNEEGLTGLGRFLHRDIVWINPPDLPGGGGTLDGRQMTMAFLMQWDLTLEVTEVISLPEGKYFVASFARGTAPDGTMIRADPWFHLVGLRDGKLATVEVFLTRDQAMEASLLLSGTAATQIQ